MKKALAWFSKAQAEGVLDPEWVLDKPGSVEDKFLTGKTGVLAFQPQYILPRYTKLQAKFPEAKIAVLPSVQGEKYNYSFFASKEGQRLTSLGEKV